MSPNLSTGSCQSQTRSDEKPSIFLIEEYSLREEIPNTGSIIGPVSDKESDLNVSIYSVFSQDVDNTLQTFKDIDDELLTPEQQQIE